MADSAIAILSLAGRLSTYVVQARQAPTAANVCLGLVEECEEIAREVQNLIAEKRRSCAGPISVHLRRSFDGAEKMAEDCLDLAQRFRKQLTPIAEGRTSATIGEAFLNNTSTANDSLQRKMVSIHAYLQIIEAYERVDNIQQITRQRLEDRIMLHTALRNFNRSDLEDTAAIATNQYLIQPNEAAPGQTLLPTDLIRQAPVSTSIRRRPVPAGGVNTSVTQAGDEEVHQLPVDAMSTESLKTAITEDRMTEVQNALSNRCQSTTCVLVDDRTTLLHFAISKGKTGMLLLLLEHSKSCQEDLIERVNNHNRTPLMEVAYCAGAGKPDSIDSLRILIEFKCTFHLRDRNLRGRHQCEALCHAVVTHNRISEQFVDLLLDQDGVEILSAYEHHQTSAKLFEKLKERRNQLLEQNRPRRNSDTQFEMSSRNTVDVEGLIRTMSTISESQVLQAQGKRRRSQLAALPGSFTRAIFRRANTVPSKSMPLI